MKISFLKVCPTPMLNELSDIKSDIWNKNCHFDKGNTYFISSPTGKGKSSFLHFIYGLRRDYQGDILFDEQNISIFKAEKWSDIRKEKLAMVFQDLRLFKNLTALENIIVKNDLIQHFSKAEILAMLEQLEMVDYKDQSVATLSYGQQQKVALIRALCQPFDFLLLDEPFSHIDATGRVEARKLIISQVEQQQAGLLLLSLGEDYGFESSYKLKL